MDSLLAAMFSTPLLRAQSSSIRVRGVIPREARNPCICLTSRKMHRFFTSASLRFRMTPRKVRLKTYAGRFFILFLLCVLHGYAFAAPPRQSLEQQQATSVEPAPSKRANPNLFVPDPPVKLVGERLFKETRFAQFFAAHMQNNDVNLPAPADPLMQVILVPRFPGGAVPNPYRGKSMNCRTCHLVDELSQTVSPVGSRSYADFQPRSRVPVREDGQLTTPRNSSNLVDALIAPPGSLFLHRDGEFTNPASLVISTLTGRNLGWLPRESAQAVAHIARVIREDDGKGFLAQRYGGASYAKLLSAAPGIPKEYILPPEYRIDVTKATDQQIVKAVARIITGYMETLIFFRDEDGRHNGSPYDIFLAKNGLPGQPAPGETDLQYSQRLLRQLESLENPKWVGQNDGDFKYFLNQPFAFNQSELEGLKIFLRLSTQSTQTAAQHNRLPALFWMALLPGLGIVWFRLSPAHRRSPAVIAVLSLVLSISALVFVSGPGVLFAKAMNQGLPRSNHAGNCATCHTPPNFTDFKFHNTGATQDEYDALHGAGAFARLVIPGYGERKRNPDAFLPPTPQHPDATGIFRSPPDAHDPRKVDLGMWNVYGNDDFPEPQRPMRALMCPSGSSCDPEQVLPGAIARFKTPTVRDLGQSDPYLHSGERKTIEDVLMFYQRASALARAGLLRNGDPAIAGITLDDLDIVYVAAFLRSLNEDYD